jgi:hypothetical protein
LQALGQIAHLPNPGPHDGGVQWAGLKRADAHPLKAAADWVLVLDIDEFVNIHAGDGTLAALFQAVPQATAITLTWRLLGNGGLVGYEDRPVPDQFRRAAPETLAWPWRAFMFKTLYRNDGIYGKLGVHRPRSPDPARLEAARWVDGAGRELGEEYRRTRLFSQFDRPNYGLVQLNHYPLGAMESYILKADRGRPNRNAERAGMDYWVERNWVSVEDTSIARYAARRDAISAELKADPQLAGLHAAAVAWRRARFAALMEEEPNRALLGRLMLTPPARPIPAEAAALLTGHARRAQRRPG